jgi:hypothetical protein
MVTAMNTVLRNPPPLQTGAFAVLARACRRARARQRAWAMPPMVQRDDVVVLLLAAMPPGARAWGWSRVVLRDRPLRQVPGLRFAKALGSGFEGGFGVKPSFDRRASLPSSTARPPPTPSSPFGHRGRLPRPCLRVFHHQAARHQQPWQRGAAAHGRERAGRADHGPVAALDRASIRLIKAPTFWRLAPAAQVDLERAQWLPTGRGPGRGAAAAPGHLQRLGQRGGHGRLCAHRCPPARRSRPPRGGLLQRNHVRALCAALDAGLEGPCVWLKRPRRRALGPAAHRVVVVGAGMGGLVSAPAAGMPRAAGHACGSAGHAGRQDAPSVGGWRPIDGGPTVFTMRWVFDEILAAAGSSLAEILCRSATAGAGAPCLAWPRSRLDLHADRQQSADAIGLRRR